jgi:hypothetical protein
MHNSEQAQRIWESNFWTTPEGVPNMQQLRPVDVNLEDRLAQSEYRHKNLLRKLERKQLVPYQTPPVINSFMRNFNDYEPVAAPIMEDILRRRSPALFEPVLPRSARDLGLLYTQVMRGNYRQPLTTRDVVGLSDRLSNRMQNFHNQYDALPAPLLSRVQKRVATSRSLALRDKLPNNPSYLRSNREEFEPTPYQRNSAIKRFIRENYSGNVYYPDAKKIRRV